MAEFKLGRIKFVYQGAWQAAQSYVVDDVISIGGKTYICVINHTSSPAFATDQTANPTKWNLISDGTQWTGDWQESTYYNLGDQVKYGGTVYVCTEAHTSATYISPTYLGLEDDSDKWEAFATSLEWIGDWSSDTRYKIRDIVTYGGTTYICNTPHISDSTLLENDILNWDVFNAGITYLGDWDNNSVNYKVNDVVKYGADLWICTTYHTSSASFDITKWSVFVHGLQFEDSWSSSETYQIGDVVTYGGYSYIAKQNHTNQVPSTASAYWDVYTTGFNFQGEWSSVTAYKVGDVIRLGAYTYLSLADHTNQTPPNNSYWSRLNTGIKWREISQTYLAVSGTNSIGTGIGATFDVERTGTTYTVTINNSGSLYSTNNVIIISGDDVGGISPANDLTITVTGVSTGAITNITSSGISSTWTLGTNYVLGDVVFFGASSFVCVSAHTGSLLNRPDADVSATYWNLIASGAESSVLTTEGDTVYYGPNGPTRLPVGEDGQILRVDDGFPSWTYYGVINNLVYVSSTGVDSLEPGRGLSIDRPWNTVRFAAKQVEEGYQNTNATSLLKRNKQFLIKEVENYMSYTFKTNISGTNTNGFVVDDTSVLSANLPIQFSNLTGSLTLGGNPINTSTVYYVKTIVSNTRFTVSLTPGGTIVNAGGSGTGIVSYYYDHAKSERDAGYIVDAVIYDIGHGGTSKTTTATLAYYNAAGTAYVNTLTGYQITQFIAGQEILKSHILSVLNNQAPAINYQRLNGVDNFADQVIDNSVTAETSAVTSASALMDIVLDGLAASTATAIVTAIQPQTTISVKTGTFTEVLPIVIPNNAAIVGDELRGTIIQPQPAIKLLEKDKPKTISSLNRIKEIVPNIISNTPVNVTSGNIQPQEYLYNNYESLTSLSVRSNVSTMVDILNGGTAPAYTLTDPSQYDTGYYNARRLLLANKDFLIDEVSSWILAQIAADASPFEDFVYGGAGQVACERDVGYIVDAIAYDLTYQGNLATQIAARSYYSNGTFVETGEKDQALAVQLRIKDIIDNIVQGNTAGWTKTTALIQDVSGTPGSVGAASFAQARIQEMYDTIDTGTEPTTIAPSTSWVDSRSVSAFTAIQADKTEIQANVISWINDNYPTLSYNQTTCSRDIGYIVDALAYDFVFKTDFLSIWNAMSYYRSLASTAIVIANQLDATVNAVYYAGTQVESATSGTDTITVNLNSMTDILKNGIDSLPAFVYPDPVDYNSGYYNARRLILANKNFLKAEVTAWINVQIGASTPPFNGFTYDQATCERDVGYIVDALVYDLTYQGNLATQIAARSYYSNGVLVEVGEESQALALWSYVKTIIDDIATGNAIVKSSGNSQSQVTSGIAGSAGAATFAQDRIQELYDTIDTGVEPTTISPSTSWVDSAIVNKFTNIQAIKENAQLEVISWIKNTYPGLYFNQTTCSRDVGYIVDALSYDCVFGSNFLSIWNAMSYYRSLTSTQVVLTEQLQPTLGTIAVIGTFVKQAETGGSSSIGSLLAQDRIEQNANLMIDIINNGISEVPAFVFPTLDGYNTTFLSGYGYGKAQIVQNYVFIKAEIEAYLNVNYNSLWTSLSATQQDNCTRDVGYILDALQYDMTYGGNTQSLIVGSSYYSFSRLTIGSNELVATEAAYARLKTIVGQIVQKQSVTATAGNAETQVTAGIAGSAGAATFAQARVQDVIDWISNGSANATISPATSDYATLNNAFNSLQERKEEIQSDAVAWVKKFYQDMNFDTVTCSRDAGLIVDALSYDAAQGGNFNSIKAGMSYHRNLTSSNLVLSEQKEAEIGSINFIKNKAKMVAGSGSIAQVNNIINNITSFIDGGAVPRFIWPEFTGVDAENSRAARVIWTNKEFIKEETIAYITENYPLVVYNKETCARDVGYILDAVRYDLTYGGNFATRQAGISYYSQLTSALQIDANDKAATLAAYGNLKTILQDIANSGLTSYTPLQSNVSYVSGTSGDATSATTVGTLIDGIITTIDTGIATAPVESLPSTSWVDSDLVAANSALQTAKTAIKATITAYIAENYPTLDYDSATCERDVGYIIDAIGYDMMFNSNYRSIKSGMSYYQNQAALVLSSQKEATIAAYNYLKIQVEDTVVNYATALERISANMQTIIDIITYGVGETPEVYGTLSYNNKLDIIRSAELLRANRTFLSYEATAWISDYFGDTIVETSSTGNVITTENNHNLTVGDPVRVTATIVTGSTISVTSTGNYITLTNVNGLVANMPILFTGGSALGNVVSNTTYFILTVDTLNSRITMSETYQGSVFNPGTATGASAFNAGGTFGGLSTLTTYYVKTVPTLDSLTLSIDNDLTTTVTLSNANGVCRVVYYYDEVSCRRDMLEYVDSLVYDLQFSGNYKSLRAAQLYNNAVGGSEYENMFLAANATGLRNCTLTGLKGTLSNPNQYGTRRPTGGAFVALNPGFGPNDSNWWVSARSHYSQNVTMFGTGCTGAKIDGALHAGGNRSMVKNDFTTILSDGIGVWVTGSSALTELVSVFNYYGYAGYLAELGGRIRATNGNSSYGTYGVIAEGVDTYEEPIHCRLNNRASQALIGNVVTDGVNEILRFEYDNAGSHYTNTVHNVSGSGYNVETIADEFRDASVFETRVIDVNDGNGSGGDGYVTFSNTAQLGDKTSITIAATDTSLSSAYVGMRIQITAGTGVGQYGNVLTYNNGTKTATIYKDSFNSLTITSTTDSGDYVNVASNATLYVDMPIYFTGTTFGSINANQLYYVKALNGTTQFTISETAGGSAVNVTTGSGSMTLLAAGWDHIIPGTDIENVLDLTSVYIIEPRIAYTDPGYTSTSRTLSATATWNSVTFGDNTYLAIANGSTNTSYSDDGKTWASAGALTTSTMTDVVYGGGEGAVATAIVGGLGGSGAVLQAVLGTGIEATQVVAVNVINGGVNYNTPPTIVFTAISGGTGATATCTVSEGAIKTVTMSINGSGYTVAPTVTAATDRLTSIDVTYWGKNYFSTPSVTISSPGNVVYDAWSPSTAVTQGDYLITTDYNIYLVTVSGTTSTVKPIHTSGSAADNTATLQYYGEQATASASLTNSGVETIALSKKGVGYTETPTVTILDTSARFVAIANSANNSCYQTIAGANSASAWTAGGSTAKTDLVSITYGNGLYIAVGGTSSAVSSSDGGSTWISRTISSTSGTWSDVTFGNGIFLAISTGAVTTSISTNGAAWSAAGTLPNSGSNTWTSVAYGNNRFVAIQTNSRSVAYSLDKGTTWSLASPGLPSSQAWSKIKYAQGLFFVIATGTDVCATSPDGISWTVRAMPSSSNWKDIAFGNVGFNPLWVAISNTSGTVASSIRTGAKALGRIKVVANAVDSVRMIEPGSGYPKGLVTATTATTNIITTDDTTNLVDSQPIEFTDLDAYGLITNTTYYVIGSTIVSNTSFKVAETAGSATPVVLTTGADLTGMYRAGPIVSQTDPNKLITAALRVRTGDGTLGNPTITNRGLNNATATASTLGDGYGDLYQPSTFISVSGLFTQPTAGANVEFASLPGVWFKLVSVTNVLGTPGDYTAQFQINPGLSVYQAPAHNDLITTRLNYSQVRLTGHDYLYIGTGNYTQTNYPNVDPTTAVQANQELFSGGGRVFFTSTDQDGNFNVGDLFGVQQATGTATLNASAFNLAGLQSLQLGAVTLGVGSAVITQFSTDPYFTANSDNIVPTQKAIKAYITAQIGGGSSSLNVNTLTSGQIFIANNSISNTAGGEIRVTSKMNFTAGVDGAPVALGYFLQK